MRTRCAWRCEKESTPSSHIGDEAYDIFDSFSDEQKGVGSVNAEGEANEYETLKHSFTTYFTPKQNSTYEIYKFRQAKQTRGETIKYMQ